MDKSLFDMDKVLDDFEFHEAHQSFMQTPGNTTNSSVGTEGSVAPQEYSANIFQSSDMSLTTGIPSLNRWTEVSDQSFWENGRGQEMPKTITKPSVSSEIPDIIRETTRCSKEIVAAKDMPAASERNGTFSSMDKENQHESTLLSFDEAPKVSSREVYLNEDLDNNAAEAVEDVKGVPVHDLVDSHVEEQKVEIDNGAAGDAVEPAIAEEATEKTVISSDSSSDSNVVHMDVMSGEMTVSHEKPEHAALKFGDLPVDLSEEDLNRELELLEEEEEYVAPTPPVSGVLSENVDLQSMGDEKDVSDGIDSRSPSTQEENLGTKNSSEVASAPGQEVPPAPMPPQSLPPSLNPPVNEQAPPQPLPKKETPPAGVVPVGIGLDFGSSSVDSHPKFKIGSSPPTSSSSEMDSELSTPSEETSSAVPPPRPPYAPIPKHLPPLPPSSVSRHQGRPPQSSIAAKHRPSSPSSISRLQPPPPPSPPISRHLPSPPPLDADPVAMSFDEEVDALERDLNATSLSLVPAVSSTPRPLSLPLSSAAPEANQDTEHQDSTSNPGPGGVGQSVATEPADVGSPPPVPVMEENADVSRVSLRDGLGTVAPKWIPDSEATNCMLCDARFTFTRRRHHCRCCGILVCASCSSQKVKLPYLEGKEGRVCQPCYDLLTEDDSGSAVTSPSSAAIASGIPSAPVACAPSVSTPPAGAGSAAASSVLPPNHSPLLPRNRPPNPNNPEEYCSTIPPFQQATAHAPPPTVMVPVGVLKRSGAGSTTPNGPKSVMFSDGIRPGGDLTELDRPWASRPRGSQRGGPNRRQDSRAGRSGASSSEYTEKLLHLGHASAAALPLEMVFRLALTFFRRALHSKRLCGRKALRTIDCYQVKYAITKRELGLIGERNVAANKHSEVVLNLRRKPLNSRLRRQRASALPTYLPRAVLSLDSYFAIILERTARPDNPPTHRGIEPVTARTQEMKSSN
ncbi:unnamed protein product [Cyprideis torosa]|uniref:Uncharacterized protein n=1 Tax=Cyprideis torosa TaxID=163714 RepID=A0A7R8ZKI7_9CRUS|nr:unnamed protein product [Cyprideis torosa]CAG0881782.1 unnamed protein product [Cyprideis torosa]